MSRKTLDQKRGEKSQSPFTVDSPKISLIIVPKNELPEIIRELGIADTYLVLPTLKKLRKKLEELK